MLKQSFYTNVLLCLPSQRGLLTAVLCMIACFAAGSTASARTIVRVDRSALYSPNGWPEADFPAGAEAGDQFKLMVNGGYFVWNYNGVEWQRDSSDYHRSQIVYLIGSVEQVVLGAANIDLGDVHTIRKGEKLAVFRSMNSYYRPIGLLTIAETHPTWSRVETSRTIEVERLDLVLAVRELAELRTGPEQLEQYLKMQIVRTKNRNQYSTRRRTEEAAALRRYAREQPKWERSNAAVVGNLYGTSFGEGISPREQRLLDGINLLRKLHQSGAASVPAAGSQWNQVMQVLHGPTVLEEGGALKEAAAASDDPDAGRFSIVDIRTVVTDRLFDRSEEEQNTVAVLVATMLKTEVGNESLWLQTHLKQTQFPYLASDDEILADFSYLLRRIRNSN